MIGGDQSPARLEKKGSAGKPRSVYDIPRQRLDVGIYRGLGSENNKIDDPAQLCGLLKVTPLSVERPIGRGSFRVKDRLPSSQPTAMEDRFVGPSAFS